MTMQEAILRTIDGFDRIVDADELHRATGGDYARDSFRATLYHMASTGKVQRVGEPGHFKWAKKGLTVDRVNQPSPAAEKPQPAATAETQIRAIPRFVPSERVVADPKPAQQTRPVAIFKPADKDQKTAAIDPATWRKIEKDEPLKPASHYLKLAIQDLRERAARIDEQRKTIDKSIKTLTELIELV